jgi:hypothetical protein
VLVLTAGQYFWRQQHGLEGATWFGSASSSGLQLTWAGTWYAWVSIPIFQFILGRWYLRIFVWVRFLWQVSRLDLRLLPTHPDRSGGLGFLGTAACAFAPVFGAQSALLSGMMAGRILFHGATLPDHKELIAGAVGILLLVALGPLLLFSGHLASAWRRGMTEYGALASRYAAEFDRKWVRGGAPPDEPLIGSADADIQSLADLSNTVEVVDGMRFVPFGRQAFIQIVLAVMLPILPLLLTMFRLDEIVARLVQVIL